MSNPRVGWVYLLTNPAMPGLVKIGFTLKTPEARASQLDGTGLPGKFVVAFALLVANPAEVEANAHAMLRKCRFRAGREFFRCSVDTAKNVLLQLSAGSIIDEITKVPGARSALLVLKSGDVIECPKCKKEIRPFNSSLTDRRAGTTRCAWCSHLIQFRMEGKKFMEQPYVFKKAAESPPRAKISGNYFRDELVEFQCPRCERKTSLPPQNLMRCPYCSRWERT